MEKFTRYLAVFGIVVSILLAILLLAVAGLLIFAPELLWAGLYHGVIIVCVLGAGWIIWAMMRGFLKKSL